MTSSVEVCSAIIRCLAAGARHATASRLLLRAGQCQAWAWVIIDLEMNDQILCQTRSWHVNEHWRRLLFDIMAVSINFAVGRQQSRGGCDTASISVAFAESRAVKSVAVDRRKLSYLDESRPKKCSPERPHLRREDGYEPRSHPEDGAAFSLPAARRHYFIFVAMFGQMPDAVR